MCCKRSILHRSPIVRTHECQPPRCLVPPFPRCLVPPSSASYLPRGVLRLSSARLAATSFFCSTQFIMKFCTAHVSLSAARISVCTFAVLQLPRAASAPVRSASLRLHDVWTVSLCQYCNQAFLYSTRPNHSTYCNYTCYTHDVCNRHT